MPKPNRQIKISDRIMKAKARKVKQYASNSNRASELGRVCLRYLVYNRTRWEEKKLHGAELQAIFDLGNEFERIIFKDMAEAGLHVIEQQRPFVWRKYNITGRIDGKLLVKGEAIPVEAKSMSPYIFSTVNTVDDIRNHKYAHVRRYLSQITTYELMDGKDMGIFIFKNKVTGQIKDIWVPLDYDLGEKLIQKAETVNKHVKDGTLPEPMEYDHKICDECGFVHLCMPDVSSEGVKIIDDDTLIELVDKWWNLKPSATEFDRVNEEVKGLVEGKEKLLVGDFYIDGKWVDSTKYNIPDKVKEKYAEKTKHWYKKIIKV